MNNYIGAVASLKAVKNMMPSYHNEDFESYVAEPGKAKARAELFGQECITVGINDTFMPIEKGDVHSANTPNLNKAQHNIKERFGYLPSQEGGNKNY